MNRPLRLFFVFALLAVLSRPAACQTADLKQLLSGNSIPLTHALKDLDSSWRSLSASTSSNLRDPLGLYLAVMAGDTPNTYYTQGETVTLGGETYIVAYRPKPTKIDYAALMKGGGNDGNDMPTPPKMTPDTVLTLTLLNLRTLGNLSDIHPFSLEETQVPVVAVQKTAEEKSVDNLKQIGLALIQYTQDADEVLPPMGTVAEADEAIYPYLKDRTLFEHPGTHQLYQVNTSLSHRKLATFDSPATMVVYFEASPGDDGKRAVLFLDGHVKRIPESQWPALKAASHIPKPPSAVPLPKGGKG